MAFSNMESTTINEDTLIGKKVRLLDPSYQLHGQSGRDWLEKNFGPPGSVLTVVRENESYIHVKSNGCPEYVLSSLNKEIQNIYWVFITDDDMEKNTGV